MNHKRTTKRTLALSLLVMLLCMVMLVGTTFAWFTDSASTAVNKIQAGTLDIALEMKGANDEWVSAEGQTLSFKKAAGAPENEEILWEPGCTYELPELRIVNKGNLALKYKMDVSGIVGDADLLQAIDFTYGDNIDISAEVSLAPNASTEGIIIKGHMKESAGNEYQDKALDGIAITVVATQDTVEYDSYNNTYDAQAQYPYPVSTDAELAEAITTLAPGSVIALTSGTFSIPATGINEGVTIAGNGQTSSLLKSDNSKINKDDVTITNLTVEGSGASGTSGSMNISGNNTTIENVNYKGEAGKIAITVSTGDTNSGTVFKGTTIENAFRGVQFWRLSGNSVIDNCVLDVSGYTFNIDATAPNATLTITDSTLNGWTSYTSGIQLVTFDNCKFGLNTYEYLRPYSETVLKDCEFTSAGYQLNAGGSGAYTITLTNCTKNGTPITADNVVSLLLDTEGWNTNATLIVNGVTVTV